MTRYRNFADTFTVFYGEEEMYIFDVVTVSFNEAEAETNCIWNKDYIATFYYYQNVEQLEELFDIMAKEFIQGDEAKKIFDKQILKHKHKTRIKQ